MIAKIFVIILFVLALLTAILCIVIGDKSFIYISIGLFISTWLTKSHFNVSFFNQ